MMADSTESSPISALISSRVRNFGPAAHIFYGDLEEYFELKQKSHKRHSSLKS